MVYNVNGCSESMFAQKNLLQRDMLTLDDTTLDIWSESRRMLFKFTREIDKLQKKKKQNDS